jgi:hypothetical protein
MTPIDSSPRAPLRRPLLAPPIPSRPAAGPQLGAAPVPTAPASTPSGETPPRGDAAALGSRDTLELSRVEARTAASEPGGSRPDPLREQFRAFVGNTLFGQMLSAMRESLDKPAYFHGGRGEEIFQQQLDQTLVEEITEASADQIADPMFELFRQRTR